MFVCLYNCKSEINMFKPNYHAKSEAMLETIVVDSIVSPASSGS